MEETEMSTVFKEKKSLWKEQYPIRFYEVGNDQKLTIGNLCNFIQNSSANHINHLGVGIDDLNQVNQTWVLSRLLVKIDEMPVWRDLAHLSTWQVCKHKLFAIRDYLLENPQGDVIVKATASWLVIDLEKRRPIPCEEYVKRMHPLKERRALPTFPDKVNPLPDWGFKSHIEVRKTDIDINGHVNNVRYLEWFSDHMGKSRTELQSPIELEVNFLGESFLGDKLEIHSYIESDKDCWYHSLKNLETGIEICRGRIQLES